MFLKTLRSFVFLFITTLSLVAFAGGKICYVERCTYCLKDQCKSCLSEGDVTVIDEASNKYILGNHKTDDVSGYEISSIDRQSNYTIYSTAGLGAVLKIANKDLPLISVQEGDFVEFRTSNLHAFLSSGQCQTVD